MSGKIFSDKTLDAALERASTDLNVAVEELDYSIVESNLEEGVFSILVEDAQGKKTNFSKNNNRGEIKETIKKQEPVPVDETPVNVEDVKEIIDGFLEKITLEIKASYTEIDDKNLEADLQGEDSKVLSENNMELLNTVEFLINRMVNKKLSKNYFIGFDADSNKKLLKEQMEDLVFRLVEKVRKTKTPLTIKSMNNFDRKVIHQAMGKYSDIDTNSSGNPDARYIIIQPCKQD